MHLMDQVTQPSEQEYRKCPVCEGPMKRYKPSRQREAARKHYGEFACVESLVPESDTIENVEPLDSVEDEAVVT